jgi:hypothetical protein
VRRVLATYLGVREFSGASSARKGELTDQRKRILEPSNAPHQPPPGAIKSRAS